MVREVAVFDDCRASDSEQHLPDIELLGVCLRGRAGPQVSTMRVLGAVIETQH